MGNLIPDQLTTADKTPVSSDAQNNFLTQLPEWAIVNNKNVMQLQRIFGFRNFAEAIVFTNRIAELAEQADHHPAIITEWGRVTVHWWTHRIHGLHLNDFVMANRTEQLYIKLHNANQ